MPLPEVIDALWSLGNVSRFRLVEKATSRHELVETESAPVIFGGILQPIPMQDLKIKPEGQRQWSYWTLWTQIEIPLDCIIEDAKYKRYRVLSTKDWSESGYYEYELTEAPRKAGT
jgi:hypothetical protein